MQRFGTQALALLLLLSGCSLLGQPSLSLPELVGTWEWEASTGGLAGLKLTPENAGYTIRVTFHTDGTFTWHRSDQPPITGRYQLFQRNGDWYVHYTPETDHFLPEQRVTFIAPDTLLLHDECADCFSHRFHKNQEHSSVGFSQR